jgi:hypothetical protein
MTVFIMACNMASYGGQFEYEYRGPTNIDIVRMFWTAVHASMNKI